MVSHSGVHVIDGSEPKDALYIDDPFDGPSVELPRWFRPTPSRPVPSGPCYYCANSNNCIYGDPDTTINVSEPNGTTARKTIAYPAHSQCLDDIRISHTDYEVD